MDRPSFGVVKFRGTNLADLSERRRTQLRRNDFGFVFQRFNLIPTLSGRENVMLPTTLAGGKLDRSKVEDLFDWLGLSGPVLARRPDEMSGGQQQRIALARALAHQPTIVFADEPTGSLDTESASNAVSLLRRVADDFGTRVVLVTHDPSIAQTADTVFSIRDGRIV